MRSSVLLCFLSFALLAKSQGTSLWVNDNVDRRLWEQGYDINDQKTHADIRSRYRPLFASDSARTFLETNWKKGRISPVLYSGVDVGYANSEVDFSSIGVLGAYVSQDIGSRIQFDGMLYGGIADGLPPHLIGAASAGIYPGLGEMDLSGNRTGQLWDGLFSLRFNPSDIFGIEVGKAKHFFGNGYRSLFLSDNPAAYPYLKLSTKVWHVEYVNLYSWQKGMLDLRAAEPRFEDKFTSTHMLSWNVSSRVNVQIFETIIWQGQDTLSDRGFDIYYLNPIIFYRPVEFAAGSADNAIIGFGASYKVYPSYELYTQIALDEFLLDQFRARNGWWGNKFGVQVGIRGFDAFKVKGLYAQAEVNVVRPFTYSHGSPVQSYSHRNQALAHPLGANFYEANLIGAYVKGQWELRNHLSFIYKGDDEDGKNLGGDIFRSYVGPERDLGNFVGQGQLTQAIQNSLYLSRVLHTGSDSRFSLGIHLRSDQGDISPNNQSVSIGFQSNFGDGYR